VALEPRRKRFFADGGHRVCPPDETLQTLMRHVDPLLGIVPGFVRLDTEEGVYVFGSPMRLAPSGALAVEVSPLPRLAELPVPVAVRPAPMPAGDFRLGHKTSLRAPYEAARRESGAIEVLFVDEPGFVTEGSWSNIFVERDGLLLTPPASLGLLPGVLRAELIEKGRAVESHLRLADLGNGFFIGNSLRGLIPARLAGTAAGQSLPHR